MHSSMLFGVRKDINTLQKMNEREQKDKKERREREREKEREIVLHLEQIAYKSNISLPPEEWIANISVSLKLFILKKVSKSKMTFF